MADRIRDKAQSNRIRRKQNEKAQGCVSDQHPWLSFRYMTTSKSHSLKFLDGLDANERDITLQGLFSQLEELARHSWLEWMENRKKTGLETLSYGELNFSPAQEKELTKDTTLYIFRFDTYQGTGQGRIIGFKRAPCATYHIIGYDFNFTAYQH